MEISDHKRETWALYHGLHLRPSHSREGCRSRLQRKGKIKISRTGDSWISYGFPRAIATSFKDADLQDILILSRVLANEFVERAITFNDNRSVRKCKLMYEALNRMLIMDMEKMRHLPKMFTVCYR